MKIGIQLYSVLNEFKHDPSGVLAALAGMGYQGIEFAFSFGDLTPERLRDELHAIKLFPVSFYSSYPLEAISDPGHELYRRAVDLGMKHITVGSGSYVGAGWEETIEKISTAARLAREHGLTLNYHNHTEEFRLVGEKPALQILAERTDPGLVKIELDTHFALKAGQDPLEWMARFAGRMPLLHIKDISQADKAVIEVGAGALNLDGVWRKAAVCGVEWAIVEFHGIAGRAPLESARICLDNLKARGLATSISPLSFPL